MDRYNWKTIFDLCFQDITKIQDASTGLGGTFTITCEGKTTGNLVSTDLGTTSKVTVNLLSLVN